MQIKKIQAVERLDTRTVGGTGRRTQGNNYALGKSSI